MKRSTGIAFVLSLLSCSVFAEDFKAQFMREGQRAISDGGKVVAIFHSDKSLATVTALVSAAMKVADKNAISAKNWVTEITYRAYDNNKKCGFVIGQWWTSPAGSMNGNWENLVYNKVKNSVNSITFQYARNNTLQVDSDTPASNGDDVMELCLN